MFGSSYLTMPRNQAAAEESLAQALCAALAFESIFKHEPTIPSSHVRAQTLVRGTVTPHMSKIEDVDEEEDEDGEEFFDAVEFVQSDDASSIDNSLHIAFSSRSNSSVELIRGGSQSPIPRTCSQSSLSTHASAAVPTAFVAAAPPAMEDASLPKITPPPPSETPLRFLRAGKGDPVLGRQRYEQTLAWRRENSMDTILKEPHPYFELVKKHYPHFFHLRGKNGEVCYYEMPPKTNLKALREGGLKMDGLLRHYAMVTEFCWQRVEPNDFGKSIYIIDLKGIRVTDFMGECVDFVRKTSAFTGQHYPERSGFIFVVNVPSWFKVIWNVVKPMVDEVTLKKIYILRGEKEIFNALKERIDVENIPPEYGGKSMPLGYAPEEQLLWDHVRHNNAMAQGTCHCNGTTGNPPCCHCLFMPARSY